MAELSRRQALDHRMNGHALWAPLPDTPAEIVGRLVAMQAQEYDYALWAIAQRSTRGPDAASLAAAVDDGLVLRTHVLRPTWHFTTPADARWLLELTGPRVQRVLSLQLRKNKLDDAVLGRALPLIEAELAGGRHRTRTQLQQLLGRGGIDLSGLELGHVMMEAELRRLVISGASIGRQRSYALFDERVPAARAPFDRPLALAELVGRFLASRGPVTLKDFAVWSGLTLGDAREGLAAAQDREPGRFEPVTVEGFECWWQVPGGDAAVPPAPRVDLVQAYDEYVMSYTPSKTLMLPTEYEQSERLAFYQHGVLIDGVLAARWKHVLRARSATVQLLPVRPLSADERTAVERAAEEYGRFLARPAVADWADEPETPQPPAP